LKGETYDIIGRKTFHINEIELVPFGIEHIFKILKWRNEQITYLRQSEPITSDEQIKYYNEVVKPGFKDKLPKQLLFSIIEQEKLIGYGGLVHIDWKNKNAEISFLLATKIFENHLMYYNKFNLFLTLIQQVAKTVQLHKIFTYGYGITSYRFAPLEKQKFNKEADLIDHIMINDHFYNAIIYSKIL